MPVGFGIGDHRMFVVDVLIHSLVGIDPVRVVRPQTRHLNTKIPQVLEAYNEELEALVTRHRIIERTGAAHEGATSAVQAEEELSKLDGELKDYMIAAEKKCRKIKSGRIPFSPEAVLWIRRLQFYSMLRRTRWGRGGFNYGNL